MALNSNLFGLIWTHLHFDQLVFKIYQLCELWLHTNMPLQLVINHKISDCPYIVCSLSWTTLQISWNSLFLSVPNQWNLNVHDQTISCLLMLFSLQLQLNVQIAWYCGICMYEIAILQDFTFFLKLRKLSSFSCNKYFPLKFNELALINFCCWALVIALNRLGLDMGEVLHRLFEKSQNVNVNNYNIMFHTQCDLLTFCIWNNISLLHKIYDTVCSHPICVVRWYLMISLCRFCSLKF